MLARIIACILTSLYLLVASPAFAAATPAPTPVSLPTVTYTQIPDVVSPTTPLYTDLMVFNFIHTISCLTDGSSAIGQPCLAFQTTHDAQGAIHSVPVLSSANLSGGLIGAATGLIAGLYANPPLRTTDYLASVGENLGMVKEANAQVSGSGNQVLNPVIKLWQVSRNIAYVFMIIIFLIIGLMVIFRQRINPQTVITAQTALPGLVIGLILITFSYFLAAFISDTAFIGTNLVGYYFAAAGNKPSTTTSSLNLTDSLRKENVVSIYSNFVGIISQGDAAKALSDIWDALGGDTQNFLRLVAALFVYQQSLAVGSLALFIPKVGLGIQQGFAIISAFGAASNVTGVVGLLLSMISKLVLLYVMFKLLLRLVSAFLNIIFLTITAPFQFLFAALPGRQGIASNWMLNMLAHVLAFPAVLAVFYFVAFMLQKNVGPINVTDAGISSAYAATPPSLPASSLVGGSAFPLFGGLDLGFMRVLLAFGALLATPSIPEIIARSIGRASQAGQLLGQEISGGVAPGQRYGDQIRGGVQQLGERGGELPTKTAYQVGYEPGKGFTAPQEIKQPGKWEHVRRAFGKVSGGKTTV